MPGTIHVSVIGFQGLPSSSVSIKVSMGKKEYQALENEDVSFPLLSLRENVIIAFYDAESNHISETGIPAILVVEKGLWVDYFPLEGSGHVHLKLQFILSEVDRNRIRVMRESALKKKQRELLDNNLKISEIVSSVSNAAALSFFKNRELSATSSGEAAKQVSVVSNSVRLSMNPESAKGTQEETHAATQASMVPGPISLSTAPQFNTEIEDDTQIATHVSNVSDPVSLYADPQSTETEEENQVATQISSVSNPVSLYADPQSFTETEEESQVATQINSVSNPISLDTNPRPTTKTEEETHVPTRFSMVSNQNNMDYQCATEEEETHIAKEPRQNSNDAVEVDISDIYFQGSTELMRTEEVSSQAFVETNGAYGSSQASFETNSNDISPQGPSEVIEMQSTSIDEPTNPKIVLSQIGSSEITIQAKQKLFSFLPKQEEEEQTQYKEKQGTLKKTPSSVKKIISAFECSQVQDKRLDLRPTNVKSASSKLIKDAPSKDQEMKEEKAQLTKAKPTGTIDEIESTQTVVNSKDLRTEHIDFNTINSSLKNEGLRIIPSEAASRQDKPQPNDYKAQKIVNPSSKAVLGASSNDGELCELSPEQHLCSKSSSGNVSPSSKAVLGAPSNDGEPCELSPEQNHCANSTSSIDGALGKAHSEVVKSEHKEVLVPVRVSNDETTTSSQIYEALPPTSSSNIGESWVTTLVGNYQELFMENSLATDIQRDLNDTVDSLGCREDKLDLCKSSSTWIFPNEKREVCGTTGCRAESTLTYQGRTSFSANRHLNESLHDDNIFCTPSDPDLDKSAKVADCRGPFGQVASAIKIAIVVGLGILVLSGQMTIR